MKERIRVLAGEILRYLAVGGTAFLVDAGTLYLSRRFLFADWGETGLYWAAALGFLAGLVYNYVLSLAFVFLDAKQRRKGRSLGAFLGFAVIGLVGLGLTELGMYAGVDLLGLHYMLVKVCVAALVLAWNYLGRKFFIFR